MGIHDTLIMARQIAFIDNNVKVYGFSSKNGSTSSISSLIFK